MVKILRNHRREVLKQHPKAICTFDEEAKAYRVIDGDIELGRAASTSGAWAVADGALMGVAREDTNRKCVLREVTGQACKWRPEWVRIYKGHPAPHAGIVFDALECGHLQKRGEPGKRRCFKCGEALRSGRASERLRGVPRSPEADDGPTTLTISLESSPYPEIGHASYRGSCSTQQSREIMPAFVEYLAKQIDMSEKKQVEIARDLGYEKANIITMFKQGLTRVPMEKVPRLARSLGIDPAQMMNMYLAEYAPEIKSTLEEVYGLILTRKERGWIELLRRVTRDCDPAPDERIARLIPVVSTRDEHAASSDQATAGSQIEMIPSDTEQVDVPTQRIDDTVTAARSLQSVKLIRNSRDEVLKVYPGARCVKEPNAPTWDHYQVLDGSRVLGVGPSPNAAWSDADARARAEGS
jgi:hypothetical protein